MIRFILPVNSKTNDQNFLGRRTAAGKPGGNLAGCGTAWWMVFRVTTGAIKSGLTTMTTSAGRMRGYRLWQRSLSD